MIPLTDIPQQYHEALAAERVDMSTPRAGVGTLLGECGECPGMWFAAFQHEDPAEGFVVHDLPIAALTLPDTPRNVRALAVVLAGACGLDASGGVTAGLVYVHAPHTDGLWIATADGARHAFWGNRTVPALSTIDPATQDALLRALAECLRALTETT